MFGGGFTGDGLAGELPGGSLCGPYYEYHHPDAEEVVVAGDNLGNSITLTAYYNSVPTDVVVLTNTWSTDGAPSYSSSSPGGNGDNGLTLSVEGQNVYVTDIIQLRGGNGGTGNHGFATSGGCGGSGGIMHIRAMEEVFFGPNSTGHQGVMVSGGNGGARGGGWEGGAGVQPENGENGGCGGPAGRVHVVANTLQFHQGFTFHAEGGNGGDVGEFFGWCNYALEYGDGGDGGHAGSKSAIVGIAQCPSFYTSTTPQDFCLDCSEDDAHLIGLGGLAPSHGAGPCMNGGCSPTLGSDGIDGDLPGTFTWWSISQQQCDLDLIFDCLR